MQENAMTYTPSIEQVDGQLTDMMIEEMLNLIYQNYYEADQFDEVFTGIVRTYINPECPTLVASRAGTDRRGGAVHYLSMLSLDYSVIHKNSDDWPEFEFMPDAVLAVSFNYPDGSRSSDWAPGVNINQATLAAIMQISREVAIYNYNQPKLDMNPNHA